MLVQLIREFLGMPHVLQLSVLRRAPNASFLGLRLLEIKSCAAACTAVRSASGRRSSTGDLSTGGGRRRPTANGRVTVVVMRLASRFLMGVAIAAASSCLALATPASSAPNYQGLWWNAPPNSESGWGINLTHQGDVIFATWFTYDARR